MIQIIRAYSDHVRKNGSKVPLHGLNFIFAAEDEHDLAYMKVLNRIVSVMNFRIIFVCM